MNVYLRYAWLIIFLLSFSPRGMAQTTITLKDSSGQPLNIGWMARPSANAQARADEFSVLAKTLVQHGEEAKLRSDWLKAELGVDQTVLGMTTQMLSLVALIVTALVSIFIAWAQHRHNKRSQAKMQTLKVWEEYLGKHVKFVEALKVLSRPLDTEYSGFSVVQQVRAWLDGMAALDRMGELDRRMLKGLAITLPLATFMKKLHSATTLLEMSEHRGEDAGIHWAPYYRDEVDASSGITAFLDRIKEV